MPPDPRSLIDAFDHTLSSTVQLCTQLADADWNRPTGCPGWTVKDQLSHIVGLERVLLGDPEPNHELPDGLPHITTDMQRYLEVHVAARRDRPVSDIAAELEATRAERIAQLRAMADADFDVERPGPMGMPITLRSFLPIRVFDAYAHEQDIRRATGHPGNLDGPAALHGRYVILASWRHIVAADAPVRVVITGPGGTSADVPRDAGAPAVATITTDMANFIALGCGRSDADRDAITIEGDAEVANRLLESAGVTP